MYVYDHLSEMNISLKKHSYPPLNTDPRDEYHELLQHFLSLVPFSRTILDYSLTF